MVSIAKYLDPSLVLFFEAKTRDEAIRLLVDQIATAGRIHDKKAFFNATIEREKIVSTGVGMGVAVPHAKLPAYEDFFIAIGILKTGVEWNAMDGTPVRFIFLIGGPDDKQTEYLQILSNLTLAIKDETVRKKMLTTHSPEGILSLFRSRT